MGSGHVHDSVSGGGSVSLRQLCVPHHRQCYKGWLPWPVKLGLLPGPRWFFLCMWLHYITPWQLGCCARDVRLQRIQAQDRVYTAISFWFILIQQFLKHCLWHVLFFVRTHAYDHP